MTFAPWQTESRLLLATLLPVSLYALLRYLRGDRVPEVFLGIVALYWLVACTHVLTTSRTAAWVLDSHMVPWVPLPSAATRLGLAWAATLGWCGLLALAAALLTRAGGGVIAGAILLGAAAAPLFSARAFPTDAYALTFRPSAFLDPAYSASALLVLCAAMVALRSRGRQREKSARPVTSR